MTIIATEIKEDVKSTEMDHLIASVASGITAEQVEQARQTAHTLEENAVAFGPIVMFALDQTTAK